MVWVPFLLLVYGSSLTFAFLFRPVTVHSSGRVHPGRLGAK